MWFIENWAIVAAVIVFIVLAAKAAVNFCKMPHSIQMQRINEWLKWAVVNAERELGCKTGELKLRRVYEEFVDKHHIMSMIISFEEFNGMVNAALEWMHEQIDNNAEIRSYIE